MSELPLLETRQLSRRFVDGSGKTLEILREVNLSLACGKSLAIVGKSGSGKSTLLHLLGSLDKPDDGDVRFEGKNLSDLSSDALADWRNEALGFVFQFHHLLPDFTALENVMMPALIGGRDSAGAEKKALELLNATGLEHRARHKVRQMSGGELQRAAVARAMINDPKLLLTDEPTGNLDRSNTRKVSELMIRVCRERGSALVVVTHNTDLAAMLDDALELRDGRLVSELSAP